MGYWRRGCGTLEEGWKTLWERCQWILDERCRTLEEGMWAYKRGRMDGGVLRRVEEPWKSHVQLLKMAG